MANDLEDFLRRAAARRQANQAARPAAPPPPPQYTSARSERVVREVEPEPTPPLVSSDPRRRQMEARRAELARRSESAGRSESTRRRAGSAASRAGSAASRAGAQTAELVRQAEPVSAQVVQAVAVAETPAALSPGGLIAALRSPEGIRQAILMREILDRPIHRW